MDRDYAGTLTSADRLYLDRLWGLLGIDPLSDTARAIEERIVVATLKEQLAMIGTRRRSQGA